MSVINKGLQHLHRKERRIRRRVFVDHMVYAAAFVAPLFNLPQLIKIFTAKNATGVSPISWIGFAIISCVWLAYGLYHKEKPIIIMNIFLIVTQVIIAVGTLMYG